MFLNHGIDGKDGINRRFNKKSLTKFSFWTQYKWINNNIHMSIIYEKESYLTRGAIYQVYKELGSGFLERVYDECVYREFRERKIPFEYKPKIKITYKNEILQSVYVPDYICFSKIIVELKAVKSLLPEHNAQLRNYLKICNLRLGFLVNFNSHPKVEIIREIL